MASRMRERLPLNELRALKNGLVILNTLLRLSAEQGGLTPMMLHGISSDFARRIDTQEPLARIAEKLGYDDTSYFIRVFRRASGMTPGRYRNLYGKG
ncbi:MAG: helix-turn-helix domain-containing protein [Spirochaetales bacterium]|nr:helix-turn-helix domain-containing protein [Spirochaetales bacterium]